MMIMTDIRIINLELKEGAMEKEMGCMEVGRISMGEESEEIVEVEIEIGTSMTKNQREEVERGHEASQISRNLRSSKTLLSKNKTQSSVSSAVKTSSSMQSGSVVTTCAAGTAS